MSHPLYESIDPETYLELAKELSLKKEASAKRTAADRAYYAAFLASRDFLAKKGYVTPYGDERDHQYINETLKRIDILGSFGNNGLRLRRARNMATYNNQEISTTTHQYGRPLEWMLNTAEEIIERVKQLPSRTS